MTFSCDQRISIDQVIRDNQTDGCPRSGLACHAGPGLRRGDRVALACHAGPGLRRGDSVALACHAGLDPASSVFAMRWKATGLRVKPAMTTMSISRRVFIELAADPRPARRSVAS
jgi:hypothetical protein